MVKTVRVTLAQVKAAKLKVKRSTISGKYISPGVNAIANAKRGTTSTHTGLFGSKTSSSVPLSAAEIQGEDMLVPYDKKLVKGAPHVVADRELSPKEEQRLYSRYGIESGTSSTGDAGVTTGQTEGYTATAAPETTQGHDTSGPTTR